MKADVKYDFDLRWLTACTKDLGENLTKMAAREVVKETRRGLIRHPDITLRRGSRGLLGTIRYQKSKYGNGYIAGVFSHEGAGKWEDTFGAQAHFLEYGHAAPGYGKYSIMGSENTDAIAKWVNKRKGRYKAKLYRYKFEEIKKHVEARPFLKPAMNKARKRVETKAPVYTKKWIRELNSKKDDYFSRAWKDVK